MADDYEPPVRTAGDHAHMVARAAIGAVPFVGAAGVELLQLILAPPLERRRTEWTEQIAAGLRRLEVDRGVRLEELGDNPVFVDAVLTATQIAIRTSQQDKRAALRNAVLNSALPTTLDVTLQQVFLALVDRFTDTHLAVLSFFQGPQRWHDRHQSRLVTHGADAAADLLQRAFPELANREELCNQLWADLRSAGLVDIDTLRNRMEGPAVAKSRTTGLGNRFLEFIANPLTE